ncbi:hypothetical protein [Flagellimonas meridianipacifica]|uniref:Uncharacterized protein n=1 Tax=Flagellimonas meridianipacifica TaxID=1080225 RepID=A0A2T0MGD6_9FLAO|nr:hypothetical protein [Allomuricauda pacifica]PRX56648.1 hypothetical protein CLV81_0645 [Allomuricauda pacifica]
MQKFKSIGFLILVIVIGYNVYDYFKVKRELENKNLQECSRKFRITNPEIDKTVADQYCKCTIERLGEKYKNSKIEAEKILEDERAVMQDCFEEANK